MNKLFSFCSKKPNNTLAFSKKKAQNLNPTKKEGVMSDLKRLMSMCALLERQKTALEEAEATAKKAKAEFDRTRTEDLPELMMEVGMTKIVTENGDTIELKEEVSTAITKEKAPTALAWLNSHGYGGIIKTQVVSEFGKGERDLAVDCARSLAEKGLAVKFDEKVHPSTLKSFVKERLAAGDDIPMDVFSIHPYNVATIKRGK